MRVLQSRREHLYIYDMSVCLKYLCPFLKALTGQILKPFSKYASIASTKEWEILEDNLCMMEGAFYTWKHLHTFLLLGSLTITKWKDLQKWHCTISLSNPMLSLKGKALLRQPSLGHPVWQLLWLYRHLLPPAAQQLGCVPNSWKGG